MISMNSIITGVVLGLLVNWAERLLVWLFRLIDLPSEATV